LRRRALAVLVSGVLATTAVAACGSSSVLGSKQQQACTAVADVLSDGPDPGADPVGYAEAQVLPLRQLKITATRLREAVDNLASAYQVYSSSNGHAEAGTVASDEKALNAICPGAAQ
jgi:hypothetical protein